MFQELPPHGGKPPSRDGGRTPRADDEAFLTRGRAQPVLVNAPLSERTSRMTSTRPAGLRLA